MGTIKAPPLHSFHSHRLDLFTQVRHIPYFGGLTLFEAGFQELYRTLEGVSDRTAVVFITDGSPSDPEKALSAARMFVDAQRGTIDIHAIQIGDDAAARDYLQDIISMSDFGVYETAVMAQDPHRMREFVRSVFIGPGVTFAYNSAALRSHCYPALDQVASFLKRNRSYKIYIDGHADSRGSEIYNDPLSHRRAQAVKDYLIKKGIGSSRLIVRAFSKIKPLRENAYKQNDALNRRVEFTLIRQ